MEPSDSSQQTETELERFRQQWKAEVQARSQQTQPVELPRTGGTGQPSKSQKSISKGPHANLPLAHRDDYPELSYHDAESRELGRKVRDSSYDNANSLGSGSSNQDPEPNTALEYYEKAVEKESQGVLGESLSHYRQAFKLDARVQEKYKNKHFPVAKAPLPIAPPMSAMPKPDSTSAPASEPAVIVPQSITELIASFANTSIVGEEPPTELSPAPPCPISDIPDEVLVDILLSVAQMDLASFARLGRVSRRFAYLVSSEDSVWRQAIQNLDYGFPSMLYNFTCTIEGDRILANSNSEDEEDTNIDPDPIIHVPAIKPAPSLSTVYPTYRQMFKTRPRIRFNGCYISTVNYTRPGAVGSNSLRWNHSILIVTYYRYLRFFRDGGVISLVTTTEPADVVPYLLKEYIHYQSTGAGHLPQAVMKDALRGRWRLSGDPYNTKALNNGNDEAQLELEGEGDVHIETEGVVSKYKYVMQLRFASGSRGAKNNKLSWVGYWLHNKLTDDVGEFGLKNDRPFFWSRVKSWY